MTSAAHAELSAELEAELVRELARAWGSLNYTHFREAMRKPTLVLAEGDARLGYWDRETRTLALSRRLVLGHSWGVVVEVLKHEMAHQYAHEVLGAEGETAHGAAFRHVCETLGIDAAASGLPSSTTETPEEGRVLERISRLLALAESPNEHEAQSAMNAAQKLMLKYNLEARGRSTYEFRHLGQPSGRVPESERVLSSILNKHFFVENIWVPVYRPLVGKRGTVLEICGTHANLAMAEYVHTFLLETGERLWKAHKRATGTRSNRDHQKFLAGVMLGFRDKLDAGAKESRDAGLVWVRDGDLDQYFHQRYPRVRSVRYGGGSPSAAYAHGRAAGQQIVLNKPMQAAVVSRGRLLDR